MKTAKCFGAAIVLMALSIISAQAYFQNSGVYGPWRYSAPYHLPTPGSCMGPYVLKYTDYFPKYQQPLPMVPGPKLPCPPPSPQCQGMVSKCMVLPCPLRFYLMVCLKCLYNPVHAQEDTVLRIEMGISIV